MLHEDYAMKAKDWNTKKRTNEALDNYEEVDGHSEAKQYELTVTIFVVLHKAK